jgi:hypothetical protein
MENSDVVGQELRIAEGIGHSQSMRSSSWPNCVQAQRTRKMRVPPCHQISDGVNQASIIAMSACELRREFPISSPFCRLTAYTANYGLWERLQPA